MLVMNRARANRKATEVQAKAPRLQDCAMVTISRSREAETETQDSKPATRQTGLVNNSGLFIQYLNPVFKRKAQRALKRIPATAARVLDRIEAAEYINTLKETDSMKTHTVAEKHTFKPDGTGMVCRCGKHYREHSEAVTDAGNVPRISPIWAEAVKRCFDGETAQRLLAGDMSATDETGHELLSDECTRIAREIDEADAGNALHHSQYEYGTVMTDGILRPATFEEWQLSHKRKAGNAPRAYTILKDLLDYVEQFGAHTNDRRVTRAKELLNDGTAFAVIDKVGPVHFCEQCLQNMGNEWILGPVCGKCCRANHRRVTGGGR
jgi:hypothetical protein